MKKIFCLLLAAVIISVVLSSCRTSRPCPAYGESKNYQIERPF